MSERDEITIQGVTYQENPYLVGSKHGVVVADNHVCVSPSLLSLIKSGDVRSFTCYDGRPDKSRPLYFMFTREECDG